MKLEVDFFFVLLCLQYYGILFGMLLVVVFAYQYLPLMKIFYLTGTCMHVHFGNDILIQSPIFFI